MTRSAERPVRNSISFTQITVTRDQKGNAYLGLRASLELEGTDDSDEANFKLQESEPHRDAVPGSGKERHVGVLVSFRLLLGTESETDKFCFILLSTKIAEIRFSLVQLKK